MTVMPRVMFRTRCGFYPVYTVLFVSSTRSSLEGDITLGVEHVLPEVYVSGAHICFGDRNDNRYAIQYGLTAIAEVPATRVIGNCFAKPSGVVERALKWHHFRYIGHCRSRRHTASVEDFSPLVGRHSETRIAIANRCHISSNP